MKLNYGIWSTYRLAKLPGLSLPVPAIVKLLGDLFKCGLVIVVCLSCESFVVLLMSCLMMEKELLLG